MTLEEFLGKLESISQGANCIWLDEEWEFGPRVIIDATFKPDDLRELIEGLSWTSGRSSSLL